MFTKSVDIMKLTFIFVILLVFTGQLYSQTEKVKGTLTLSGAWALYPMAVRWAEEFRKINPDVRIDISAGGAGKGITDALNNMVDLGMVSREIYAEELKKGAYPVAVTKDAVVPVISASNPALGIILSKGLKKDAGNNIWITGMYKTWAQAFGIKGFCSNPCLHPLRCLRRGGSMGQVLRQKTGGSTGQRCLRGSWSGAGSKKGSAWNWV